MIRMRPLIGRGGRWTTFEPALSQRRFAFYFLKMGLCPRRPLAVSPRVYWQDEDKALRAQADLFRC